MEVLVFRTTVEDLKAVEYLGPRLDSLVGRGQWNFALDDRDKILRIVSGAIRPEMAIDLLAECGFDCCELTD